MKFLLTIFIILLPLTLTAAQLERPSKKYPDQAVDNYGWLLDYKLTFLSTYINDTGKKFISNDSLKRYVKLKLRNFVSGLKLKEEVGDSNFNYNYLNVELKLSKYNDKQKIYYGLISFKMAHSVYRKDGSDIYKLTKAIAGSEAQILSFIKGDIDSMIELFAEDYYFVSDEIEKHNKPIKQDK